MIKVILITTSTCMVKTILEQQLHDENNYHDDTMQDFCMLINYDCNFNEKMITGTLIFASKIG